MTHREEIEYGRRIGYDVLTAYRCIHNHAWYLLGPHIWCICKKRIDGLPIMPRVLTHRGGQVVNHECDPVCELKAHRGFRLPMHVTVVRCRCGARTRDVARFNQRTLRAAAAAHLLGGIAAVRSVLGMGAPHGPASETLPADSAEIFAGGFPANLTQW